MTSLTSYLIVILIVLIILLTITYTTDITIPIPKIFTNSESSNSYSNIEYEKKKQQTSINRHNPINLDSENINKQLFNYTEDFQMTENTGNVIANALNNMNIN